MTSQGKKNIKSFLANESTLTRPRKKTVSIISQ